MKTRKCIVTVRIIGDVRADVAEVFAALSDSFGRVNDAITCKHGTAYGTVRTTYPTEEKCTRKPSQPPKTKRNGSRR